MTTDSTITQHWAGTTTSIHLTVTGPINSQDLADLQAVIDAIDQYMVAVNRRTKGR